MGEWRPAVRSTVSGLVQKKSPGRLARRAAQRQSSAATPGPGPLLATSNAPNLSSPGEEGARIGPASGTKGMVGCSDLLGAGGHFQVQAIIPVVC